MLAVADLTVAYGGVVAVREVSLAVHSGQVLALLGANGAGKTTTLRAISGLTPKRSGVVLVDGEDVTGLAPEKIARLGVAHVPAGRGVFGTLSVEDNLRMALHGSGRGWRSSLAEIYDTFPVLSDKRSTPAATLSGGQQQQLAIGRALVQQPRLLLVDEMSMGLAPTVVAELFRVVAGLRERGIAVVMVEQFVTEALKVADLVAILEQGRVVASGRPDQLGHDDVAAAYLGGGQPSALCVEDPPAHATERLHLSLPGRDVRALEHAAAERHTTIEALLATAAEALLQPEALP